MLTAVQRKIVSFWLTHGFLRRIAKRYPEYFEHWINDLTDNLTCRKVMKMRYMSDPQKTFEVIGLDMGMDTRNVFKYHKQAIDLIISGN